MFPRLLTALLAPLPLVIVGCDRRDATFADGGVLVGAPPDALAEVEARDAGLAAAAAQGSLVVQGATHAVVAWLSLADAPPGDE